ncbi:flagellar hook-associated protein FlgL [Vibrio breoganii]
MRVPDSFMHGTMNSALMKSNAGLNKVFHQISTGKELLYPSDNPVGTVKLQNLQSTISTQETYATNIKNVETRLGLYETHLGSLSSITLDAKDLLLQARNGNLDAESREGIVRELESLKDEFLSVANTKQDGSYLFSGSAINTPAIGVSPPYTHQGNYDTRETIVGDGVDMVSNITLDDVFGGADFLNLLDTALVEMQTNGANMDQAISDALEATDAVYSRVNATISTVGSRQNNLERMYDVNMDTNLYMDVMRGEIEDLDYAEASVRMQQHMMTLQASQTTFMQLTNLSLFRML